MKIVQYDKRFQKQLINKFFLSLDRNSKFQMMQEILNYEHELIEKQTHYSEPYLRICDPHSLRYSPWRLHEIIERVVPRGDYSIKWIGSDPNAHILAFLYCMLTGCLTDSRLQNDLFLQFKYSLYQQSKQSLSLAEQKIFVQHLGLVEDSKNISQFLKKSNHLQAIFTKLFLSKCSQMNRRKFNSNLSIKHIKNEELEWFSNIFSFIEYKIITQNCFCLTMGCFNFFIIQEKDCFFVLEDNSQYKSRIFDLSEVYYRKKMKTEIYGQGGQFINQIRGCGMIDSHQQINQNYIRTHNQIVSRSQSRDGNPPTQQNKHNNEASIQQRISQMKKIQQSVQRQKNNHLTSKLQKLISNNIKKSKSREKKYYQKNMKDYKSHVQLNNMRLSVKDDKLYRLFGTPKISEEKKSKENPDRNRSSRKKRIARVYSPPNEMPEISQNQQIIRHNFISQSLNKNQSLQLKAHLSPKNRNRIPKFLIKRNEEPGYTFHNSPSKQERPTRKTVQRQNIPVYVKQNNVVSGAIKTMIRSYKETGSFTKRN